MARMLPSQAHPTSPVARTDRPGHDEYRWVTLPRGTSVAHARRLLTDEAEYGKWELATVRLYVGGIRRVRLRRRVIPAARSV